MGMFAFDNLTKYVFYTGKGGVGKTSLACATAVALADSDRKVLLVSTDPASNLDDVLGMKVTNSPQNAPSVDNLFVLNVDPVAAAAAYREKVVAPYRCVLPEAAVKSIEEQLSGACTMEIAAFDEFARLIGEPTRLGSYDTVIFDTAPTGHTLRLLSLPNAWSSFIDTNAHGASCLGPLSGLGQQKALYAATVKALSNPSETTLVLVSRLDISSLYEADRAREELASLGIRNQLLILNGVFHAEGSQDPIAKALAERESHARNHMPAGLANLPYKEIPLKPINLVGIDALRSLLNESEFHREQNTPQHINRDELPQPLINLVDDIAKCGHGVVMTMGKGGVGKTTIAAAIAVELARRGFPVHLSTTDPAAHIAATVQEPVSGLTVGCIDPKTETETYRNEVLTNVGAKLDAEGRAMLEEDLRSPCTEEIAVFRAFAKEVEKGKDGYVVLDTAPTGHTILLLDASETYHREVARKQSDLPESVRELLPRLRNPDYTHVFIVTLAEATPVSEAARLQEDLRRAEIEPHAWVINQSLVASSSTHPLLVQRGRNELPFIKDVADELSNQVALVSWQSEPPVGAEALSQLVRS
jgi:arsenite-transporting ATPase